MSNEMINALFGYVVDNHMYLPAKIRRTFGKYSQIYDTVPFETQKNLLKDKYPQIKSRIQQYCHTGREATIAIGILLNLIDEILLDNEKIDSRKLRVDGDTIDNIQILEKRNDIITITTEINISEKTSTIVEQKIGKEVNLFDRFYSKIQVKLK